MGLRLFGSSSSQDRSVSMFERWKSQSSLDICKEQNTVILPNPRPDNYSLVRSEVVNGHLIIELKYHDCTNYEGRKIMVYKCTLDELMKQKLIDPHFCNNEDYFSPIARFEPTEQGWNNACALANVL